MITTNNWVPTTACTCYLLLTQYNLKVNIIVPILQIKKLKLKKVNWLTENHMLLSGRTNIQT